MSNRQPVPTLADVIGPAIDKIREVRPSSGPHLENGRYGDVIEGWRHQFEVARGRLADEFAAARIPTAEGKALSELASSEFEVAPLPEQTFALGQITFFRASVHYRSYTKITAADATDDDSAEALIRAIRTSGNTHAASAFNPTTGLGSHADAVTSAPFQNMPFLPTMGTMVTYAEDYRTLVLEHFANAAPFAGQHPFADTLNTIDAPTAFASAFGDVYDDNTFASQQSLLKLLNAIKVALNAHFDLESKAGTIRRGTRIELRANPTISPPIQACTYVTTSDVSVPTGSTYTFCRCVAETAGEVGNRPAFLPAGALQVLVSADELFDSEASIKLVPVGVAAAGGGIGQVDPDLRRAMVANWTGRYGPTLGALLAGVLADSGAARSVVREDLTSATATIWAVDRSWAYSTPWLDDIESKLSDPISGRLGWGCKLYLGLTVNRLIRLEITAVLRNATYLVDTTSISDAITKALRSYFDDRPDWYVWRLSAIRGVVAKADRRIQSCSLAIVLDGDGEPIAEPIAPSMTTHTLLTHYYLADNPISVTFTIPS